MDPLIEKKCNCEIIVSLGAAVVAVVVVPAKDKGEMRGGGETHPATGQFIFLSEAGVNLINPTTACNVSLHL